MNQDNVLDKGEVKAMEEESMTLIIGVIQGVRETLECYRDELGAGDLFTACASLEKIEGDLFKEIEAIPSR